MLPRPGPNNLISERQQIHPRQEAFARAEQNRGVGEVHLIDESSMKVLSGGCDAAAQPDILSFRSLSRAREGASNGKE
jgi:hypothetical protein